MSIYQSGYENLKGIYHEKMARLYAIFPWDDLFNDTIYGSPELDCLVDDALRDASPSDAEIIKAHKEAISIIGKITIYPSNSIEEKEKLLQIKDEVAKIIVERTDSFVEVVLAYYNKMVGKK